MASGATHKTATIGLAFGIAGAGMSTGYAMPAIIASTGCLFGLWCQPDRDHVANKSLLWYPYSRVFKHRGISHFPLVGTLTRLAYLSIPFVAMWSIVELAIRLSGAIIPPWTIPQWLIELMAWWLAGLMVSDMGHWVLDWHIWRVFRHEKRKRKTISSRISKGSKHNDSFSV